MRSADIGAILGALAGATPGFIVGADGMGMLLHGQGSPTAWGLMINGSLVAAWGALMGAAVGAVAGAFVGVAVGLVYRLVHNLNKRAPARAAAVSGRGYNLGDKAHSTVEPALVPVSSTDIARK
jgi:hypothetical protein